MRQNATALREAFDQAFIESPDQGGHRVDQLLAISVASRPCAVRLTEIAGLFAGKRLTPLPGPSAELLGLAGLHGAVVPVYDLAKLMGFPPASSPRWLMVAAASPVGLAFETFEGYLSVAPGALVPEVESAKTSGYVREILYGDRARPVVHLASILETIERRVRAHDQT